MPTGAIEKKYDDRYKTKAKELVSQMTKEEKVYQMMHGATEISRLGIPAYNWWNEALHGVARAGVATVFPQAIGLAATFSPELIHEVADVISTEGRAKYEAAVAHGDRDIYKGLTFWSPNINIFRDPRWGRGHETYGEDPYLTGELGKAFIRGIQGDDPEHLKAAACAKHFAVHSGPENLRHEFDAIANPKDLWETYLYAFEECIVDGKVESIMGAYNRVNGEASCAHSYLLEEVLRGKWAFDGHMVSDCWAIRDLNEGHGLTKTIAESSALAVKRGCDLNCGVAYYSLVEAMDEGLISEEDIDKALVRLMTARMRLGILGEEPKKFSVPYSAVDCKEHRQMNLEAARRSMVLLKNDGLLPVKRSSVKKIAVIGPNSDNLNALLGNYCGTPNEYETPLRGITNEAAEGTRILYAEGCHISRKKMSDHGLGGDRMAEALTCAEEADLVVLCLGLDAYLEGEQSDTSNLLNSGDKPGLDLPGLQGELLDAMIKTGKPLVVAVLSGSALDLSAAQAGANAVVQAFYPGALGGRALAQMIFGDFSPSGRLPVTFYKADEELPEFTDYSMAGRTYRYMETRPLYPFGYGLSYTDFEYSGIEAVRVESDLEKAERNDVCYTVSAKVKNMGKYESWETAQLYLTQAKPVPGQPKWQLRGVCPVYVKPGEEATVEFEIMKKHLLSVMDDGSRVILPGGFTIYVGGSQPDARSMELLGREPVRITV